MPHIISYIWRVCVYVCMCACACDVFICCLTDCMLDVLPDRRHIPTSIRWRRLRAERPIVGFKTAMEQINHWLLSSVLIFFLRHAHSILLLRSTSSFLCICLRYVKFENDAMSFITLNSQITEKEKCIYSYNMICSNIALYTIVEYYSYEERTQWSINTSLIDWFVRKKLVDHQYSASIFFPLFHASNLAHAIWLRLHRCRRRRLHTHSCISYYTKFLSTCQIL